LSNFGNPVFSWTVEDEWKVGKKTLQAAVSQRMISIEKKKRLWKK
jgi:aminopeptidase-like protein